MFRVINSCKRVIKIGDTLINYGKWAEFDDSYLYELEKFKQLINDGLVKVIYNLTPKKTMGYKLENESIHNLNSEDTEKDSKNEDSVEDTEIIETETKSNKRKKKLSKNNENN